MSAKTIGAEELASLATLLRGANFRTGASQIIAAQRLLWRLADQGIEVPHAELAPWLAPVFCTTKEEQEQFRTVFENWRPDLGEIESDQVEGTSARRPTAYRRVLLLAVLLGICGMETGRGVGHGQLKPPPTPPKIIEPPITPPAPPRPRVTETGTLFDDDSNPVAGATLSVGGIAQQSGGDGRFQISGEDSQVVLVSHDRYDAVSFPLQQRTGFRITMARRRVQTPIAAASDGNAPPSAVSLRMRIVAASIPLLACALWLAYVYWKRLSFRKWQNISDPVFTNLGIRRSGAPVFNEADVQRAVQEMRRPKPIELSELWPEGSVTSTVENAGWFTPFYRPRNAAPEYLVLVDQSGRCDHLAQFGGELTQRLKNRGVYLDVFQFHRDPRSCFEPGKTNWVSLKDLSARFGRCEVVVVSDGAEFFNRFTGRLESWVQIFEQWRSRVLLTPTRPAEWLERERRLIEAGFELLPATARGLARLAEPASAGTGPAAGPYPPLLESLPHRWTDPEPPRPEDIMRLCTQLRLYLGADGFRWLSACAIYPAIEWSITLHLGENLIPSQDLGSLLGKLLRFPWFRRGIMPEWLRKALLRGMDKTLRKRVRRLLDTLLLESVAAGPSSDAHLSGLDVILRDKARRKMQRDEVFLSFLWGRNPDELMLSAPSRLKHLLFPSGRGWLGLRPAAALGTALVLSAGIWVGTGLMPPPHAPVLVSKQPSNSSLPPPQLPPSNSSLPPPRPLETNPPVEPPQTPDTSLQSGGGLTAQTIIPWLTRSADNSRSGWNLHETQLTQASVAAKGIVRVTIIPVIGDARGMEAQPLILPNVQTARGIHDVMILPSMANVVRGVDAHNGSSIWQVSLGMPVTGSRQIDAYSINPHWGCLSTGVIDPDTQRLYQVCWVSPDGTGKPQTARYFMFVLNVADGRQVVPPVLIQGKSGTQDFNSAMRKQRSSLVETNVNGVKTVFGCSGSIFETGIGTNGFCFAFDVATNQLSAMLAMTAGAGAGVWMSGQGPVADPQGFLYAITSNGYFDGITQFGESFVKLEYTPPSGKTEASLRVVDHWTPWTDRVRSGQEKSPADKPAGGSAPTEAARPASGPWSDQDLGAAGPACIFLIDVCVAAGKDGIAYPIKTRNLGGTTPANLANPKANCAKLAGPPVWLTIDHPGTVDPCPSDPRTLNFFPFGDVVHLFMTPVQFFDPLRNSWTIFVWGANSQLRKWAVSSTGALTYITHGNEYASADVRGTPPGGMPGGFCSGSSNGADPNSAILVCTIPYGNANAAIVNGRLLVYDAVHLAEDGSLKVLWDSQRLGVQFLFNKFDPPVIDGGQVYVPNYNGGVDVYRLKQ